MKFFKRHLKKQKNIGITDETVESMNRLITILDEEINNIFEAYNLISKKHNLPFVLNSVLFFRTTFKDIVLVTKQMISEKDEQQKNIHARTVALHLYEFLDDTKDFLGQKMRKELELLPDSNFHIQELNKLKKYYQTIKKSIFQELSDIRHSVIGHKDQNSIELNRKIKEINPANINSSCMIVWVMFTLILRFQKNIIISIRNNYNKKDELQISPDASFDIDDNKNKLISIDFQINQVSMLINGISPTEIKFINELQPVVVDKIKELGKVEKLNLSMAIKKLSHDELISIYNVLRKYEKIKLNSQK